jgi:hypothetical protein
MRRSGYGTKDPELPHRERLLGAAKADDQGGGGGQGHHAGRRGKEAAMAGGRRHPTVGRVIRALLPSPPVGRQAWQCGGC